MSNALIEGQPFIIFYYLYVKNYGIEVGEKKFEKISEIADIDVGVLINEVAREFNTLHINIILSYTPYNSSLLVDYTLSLIGAEHLQLIDESWPASVPNFSDKILELLLVYVRIVYSVTDQGKFIKWMLTKIFPIKYDKETSDFQNNNVKAVCSVECKNKKCKGNNFVVLSYDDNLLFFDENNNEERMGIVKFLTLDKNSKRVSCEFSDGNTFSFVLTDDKQLDLWSDVCSGKVPPFAKFLTSPYVLYPAIVFTSFANSLLASDNIMLFAFLCYIDKYQRIDIIKDLFNVYSYQMKLPILIRAAVIFDLRKPNFKYTDIIRENSVTHSIYDLINVVDEDDYYTHLNKVIEYLDSKTEVDEITFMSFFKYMVGNNGIPILLRFFLSVIRVYFPIVNNDKESVYNVLKFYLFDQFILKFLNTKTRLGPGKECIKMFEDFLNHNYPMLVQKRLNLHYKNYEYGFVFSSSEPCCLVSQNISWDYFIESMSSLIANAAGSDFSDTYSDVLKDQNRDSTLSWNFVSCVLSFFRQCYDNDIIWPSAQSDTSFLSYIRSQTEYSLDLTRVSNEKCYDSNVHTVTLADTMSISPLYPRDQSNPAFDDSRTNHGANNEVELPRMSTINNHPNKSSNVVSEPTLVHQVANNSLKISNTRTQKAEENLDKVRRRKVRRKVYLDDIKMS